MEEAGWLWVTNFGDVDAEYRAVREGVGMWDLSPLNKWEFRGPEALEAAQRVHSNDIVGMRDGQVRYGAFVDEDGLVVDDGTVFRHSAEHLWVCTNGNDRAEYFADAMKGLEVTIAYIAAELPSLQIQGPRVANWCARRHRRRRRRAAVLQLLPRPGDDRRGAGEAVAHRVLRRARLRGVPAPRARGRGRGKPSRAPARSRTASTSSKPCGSRPA